MLPQYDEENINQNNRNQLNENIIVVRINSHEQDFYVLITILCLIMMTGLDIIALYDVNYYETKNTCQNSNLWLYVLLYMILHDVILLVLLKLNNIKVSVIIMFILSLASILFGEYELDRITCVDDLRHTLLYQMAFVQMVCSYVMFVFDILIIISYYLFRRHR